MYNGIEGVEGTVLMVLVLLLMVLGGGWSCYGTSGSDAMVESVGKLKRLLRFICGHNLTKFHPCILAPIVELEYD